MRVLKCEKVRWSRGSVSFIYRLRFRFGSVEVGIGRYRVVGIVLFFGSCFFICKIRGLFIYWIFLDFFYGDFVGLDVEVWDWIIFKRFF